MDKTSERYIYVLAYFLLRKLKMIRIWDEEIKLLLSRYHLLSYTMNGIFRDILNTEYKDPYYQRREREVDDTDIGPYTTAYLLGSVLKDKISEEGMSDAEIFNLSWKSGLVVQKMIGVCQEVLGIHEMEKASIQRSMSGTLYDKVFNMDYIRLDMTVPLLHLSGGPVLEGLTEWRRALSMASTDTVARPGRYQIKLFPVQNSLSSEDSLQILKRLGGLRVGGAGLKKVFDLKHDELLKKLPESFCVVSLDEKDLLYKDNFGRSLVPAIIRRPDEKMQLYCGDFDYKLSDFYLLGIFRSS